MTMATLLWIVAAILVIAGIVAIVRRQLIWGHRADRGGTARWSGRGQHLHLIHYRSDVGLTGGLS